MEENQKMSNIENKFDSFDDSLLYYTRRISPFLTKDMFNELSMNPSDISKFMNKETYDSVTKHTNYECEPFFDRLKLKIYLINKNNKFTQSEKCLATHILEQVFDENNQLVSEEIKEL